MIRKRTRFLPLVALALLLGLLGLLSQPQGQVHAASIWHSRDFITNCCNDTQLQQKVMEDHNGETLVFACSGKIALSKTLTITGKLTLVMDLLRRIWPHRMLVLTRGLTNTILPI